MEIKIMKMDDGYELFVNSVLVKKGKVLAHIRMRLYSTARKQ